MPKYAPWLNPVEKVWKDNDNQDGKRPNSITVRLYADGVEVDSKEIKKAFLSNEWNPVVFENLPKYLEYLFPLPFVVYCVHNL